MNTRNITKIDAFMKTLTEDYLVYGGTTEFSTLAVNRRKLKPLLRTWTKYLNDHGYIGRWEANYCTACAGHHGRRRNLHVHILSAFWVEKEMEEGKLKR